MTYITTGNRVDVCFDVKWNNETSKYDKCNICLYIQKTGEHIPLPNPRDLAEILLREVTKH